MTCHRLAFGDGIVGTVCIRGQRERRRKCGCGNTAQFLCDARRGLRTCDLPLCFACRVRAGEDRDLCRVHAAMEERQAREAAEREKARTAQPLLPGLDVPAPLSHERTRR